MAAITYFFRPFLGMGLTTAQRTGDSWDGGTNGIVPKRCYIWDSDLSRLYIGDGTPENAPSSGTVGGMLIGPEVYKAGNYGIYEGIISPTGASGTQHNYNPTGLATATVLRITPNGANITLTGIESQTGAIVAGRILVIENISTTFDVNLVNENTGSDADNRIAFTAAANETLAIKPNGCFTLWYDNTSQRWRPFNATRPTKHFHGATNEGGKIGLMTSAQFVPATNGKHLLGFTTVAITIQSSTAFRTGGTNFVYNIRHASTWDSGSPNDVFTSNITITSTSGTTTGSGFNDNTIPASSWVWVHVASQSGSPTDAGVTIDPTTDFA